jgi:hypothetical protein
MPTAYAFPLVRQPAKTRGRRGLAFKWIRILWRCWHDHIAYDESRYLTALRQRRSPLAHTLHLAA